jgi:hypothetical protein
LNDTFGQEPPKKIDRESFSPVSLEMPGHYTESITDYLIHILEEHYGTLPVEEQRETKKRMDEIFQDMNLFKEYCGELIAGEFTNYGSPFFDAVVNSIDWNELRNEVKEYLCAIPESEDEIEIEVKGDEDGDEDKEDS